MFTMEKKKISRLGPGGVATGHIQAVDLTEVRSLGLTPSNLESSRLGPGTK
jgi:hypothetical protein